MNPSGLIHISPSYTSPFGILPSRLEALEQALGSGRPEVFNTDQGCQFTSAVFGGVHEAHEVRISMNGRGRVFDNIFIERLWRTVKYEDIYLRDYGSVVEPDAGLGRYFRFYNEESPHQSLGYRTPVAVHGVVKL